MKNMIKVRTFLGQAIDTFKEYIKTKGNLQTDYPLEKYMQEILDYIDYLEKENKQQKNNINQMNDSVNKSQKELNEENLQCSKYAIEINDLKEKSKQLKEDIKNIINILNNNCDDLEATEEEFDSLERYQNEYIS